MKNKRLLAAVALLTGSLALAAFANIARHNRVLPPATRPLIEALTIYPGQAVLPAPVSYVREEQFQQGDTLAALLSRLAIDQAAVPRLMRTRALRLLRPGTNVHAEVSAEGAPLSLSFLSGRDTLVTIAQQGDGYHLSEGAAPLETSITTNSSVIRSSLFAATERARIPDGIALQLAEAFAGDLDFYRDLRRGDRFTVVYEIYLLRGRPVRAGRLLAAEFINQGHALRAIHYQSAYYTPDGKSVRKPFLRYPLEFSRVSSGFGMRRHPLYGGWRAHKGIDYAAPTGTRVRAVADGVVEYSGIMGGYGKVVVLRHYGERSTLYGHLSRIAVRRGEHVKQNATVGLVGDTGWATGPHLHYELRVAGQPLNPEAFAMPAAQPVALQELAAFQALAQPLVARLDLSASVDVALLD